MSEHLVVLLTDAQLDQLAERVVARLSNGNGNGHSPEEPDKLLTADEAAQRLGVKIRWLYGRSRSLPFTVHLPGWQKERVRLSLGTADLVEARRRRDDLLSRYPQERGCALSLRLGARRSRATSPMSPSVAA